MRNYLFFQISNAVKGQRVHQLIAHVRDYVDDIIYTIFTHSAYYISKRGRY